MPSCSVLPVEALSPRTVSGVPHEPRRLAGGSSRLNDFRDIEHRPHSGAPNWALWLIVVVVLTSGAVIVGAMASKAPPRNEGQAPALVAGQSTFSDAATSMRSGRDAEAYGRFVALAEQGDVDAARMALLMFRFGPTVFGYLWDASPEQIERWTLMSKKAEDRDLAHVRSTPAQAAERLAMQRLAQ